jgi:hypothetical protein
MSELLKRFSKLSMISGGSRLLVGDLDGAGCRGPRELLTAFRNDSIETKASAKAGANAKCKSRCTNKYKSRSLSVRGDACLGNQDVVIDGMTPQEQQQELHRGTSTLEPI